MSDAGLANWKLEPDRSSLALAEQCAEAMSIERAGARINSIKVDFNALGATPNIELRNGVLTVSLSYE